MGSPFISFIIALFDWKIDSGDCYIDDQQHLCVRTFMRDVIMSMELYNIEPLAGIIVSLDIILLKY